MSKKAVHFPLHSPNRGSLRYVDQQRGTLALRVIVSLKILNTGKFTKKQKKKLQANHIGLLQTAVPQQQSQAITWANPEAHEQFHQI